MNENDKKVKELWDIVSAKKEAIQKAEKPNWKTNCTFSYSKEVSNPHGRFNVQTITDPADFAGALGFLYRERDSYEVAAKDLGLATKFKWQGYTVDDWKSDFQTRIDKIKITDKKKELALLEGRLGALLSPELKTQLELADIQRALSGE